jgi:hypothetical protein
MKRLLIPAIIALASSLVLANTPTRPIPAYQWNPEAKVWLARSCVGEAGIHAHDECMGIAWTYATRASETGTPFLRLIKKYSAAIKPHSTHRRRWIFELNLKGDKPKHWPRGLKWSVYRYQWTQLLFKLDRWSRGQVSNPVPGANHFGGPMDTPHIKWIQIKTPLSRAFKNKFYRETRVRPSRSRAAQPARL